MKNTKLDFNEIREYFPDGVNIAEPPAPADFKEEILSAWPEGKNQVNERHLSLFERAIRRIKNESQNGKKNICYLLITHGTFVHEAGHIFNMFTAASNV